MYRIVRKWIAKTYTGMLLFSFLLTYTMWFTLKGRSRMLICRECRPHISFNRPPISFPYWQQMTPIYYDFLMYPHKSCHCANKTDLILYCIWVHVLFKSFGSIMSQVCIKSCCVTQKSCITSLSLSFSQKIEVWTIIFLYSC